MCFKDDLAFSLIALGIIGYIYTVFEFIIILPWLGWSVVGKAHLVVVNTLAFMLLYSYFAASFTDPGSPPDDYVCTTHTKSQHTNTFTHQHITD